jgi:OPA family glycerol-3-phosphate transporter-like MFS transporter
MPKYEKSSRDCKIPIDYSAKERMKSLFLLCWFAYFTSYIGRLDFPSVMAAIIAEKKISTSQAGFINMVYFFAYGIGQVVNGFLGDKIQARKMIFLGLFCSGCTNLMTGAVNYFIPMALFWGMNGYFQSMIWPPVIRIFAEQFTEKEKENASVNIVSSMVAGTLVSYLMSAVIMKISSWTWVFFIAAGCLFLMSGIWEIQYKRIYMSPADSAIGERDSDFSSVENISYRKNSVSFKDILLGQGLLLVIIPVIIHGTIKDGVTSWVPTYICEKFLTTPSFSVLVTLLLPIMNLTGAYMAQYMNGKYKNREMMSATVFFGIASGALVFLLLFGSRSIILTGLLLAVLTSSMMAVNTLFINLLPLHFRRYGKVSTVSGFLNALAYMGSAIASFSIGILVERYGWNTTVESWLGETLLALFICIVLRQKKFVQQTEDLH